MGNIYALVIFMPWAPPAQSICESLIELQAPWAKSLLGYNNAAFRHQQFYSLYFTSNGDLYHLVGFAPKVAFEPKVGDLDRE